MTKPFKDKLICTSHILSEIGFLFYTSALFPFLSEQMESSSRESFGSIIIWGLISLIGVIWIIFIIHIIKLFLVKINLQRLRVRQEKEEIENQRIIEIIQAKEKRRKLREDTIKQSKEHRLQGTFPVDIYIYIYIYIESRATNYNSSNREDPTSQQNLKHYCKKNNWKCVNNFI